MTQKNKSLLLLILFLLFQTKPINAEFSWNIFNPCSLFIGVLSAIQNIPSTIWRNFGWVSNDYIERRLQQDGEGIMQKVEDVFNDIINDSCTFEKKIREAEQEISNEIATRKKIIDTYPQIIKLEVGNIREESQCTYESALDLIKKNKGKLLKKLGVAKNNHHNIATEFNFFNAHTTNVLDEDTKIMLDLTKKLPARFKDARQVFSTHRTNIKLQVQSSSLDKSRIQDPEKVKSLLSAAKEISRRKKLIQANLGI